MIALLSFSGHIGARVIAEGIETARERETLQSLGLQFGQGWLLGRPALVSQLGGQTDEVVNPTWFTRRQVSATRVGPSDIRTASTSAAAGPGQPDSESRTLCGGRTRPHPLARAPAITSSTSEVSKPAVAIASGAARYGASTPRGPPRVWPPASARTCLARERLASAGRARPDATARLRARFGVPFRCRQRISRST